MKLGLRKAAVSSVVVVVLVTVGTTMAWDIEYTTHNYEQASNFYVEYDDGQWGYGWAAKQCAASGSGGYYLLTCAAWCDPGSLGWYEYDTNTQTSDGYRKRTVEKGCGDGETTTVTWEIDGSVKITGHFDADNQMALPYGDCYFYGWGKQILSGLADGEGETKGTFTAEEGDENISAGAGPIAVSLPILFNNDDGDLNGDDTVSDGDTETVSDGDFIKLRGTVVARANTGDGGEESTGTVESKVLKFSMELQ